MFAARLAVEVKRARQESDKNFFLYPDAGSLQSWQGYLLGPEDSPYQDGVFHLRLSISSDFPVNPPKVTFLTKIYHPNIHWTSGEVCLDILKSEWTVQWSLSRLGKALSSLLFDPNADSPLNCDAGNMIRAGDDTGFRSTAELVTRMTAIPRSEYLKLFESHESQKLSSETPLSDLIKQKDN